jgi:hypothetical protein
MELSEERQVERKRSEFNVHPVTLSSYIVDGSHGMDISTKVLQESAGCYVLEACVDTHSLGKTSFTKALAVN